jgi:putative PIN family toxin of toxin-antitoxin system
LVVDTNVLVSALLWPGIPTRLIERAVEGEAELFTSRALLDELREVLRRPKFARYVEATGLSASELTEHYHRLAHMITARRLLSPICRDADDDAVLACAAAANADAIVTGDADLLILRVFRDIPILKPAGALRLFPSRKTSP